ncbi:MAG: hypothetical protein JRN62_02505 [Nitrososphaerota archaeon]|jgi:hypothetical protein|nr:hypothetical protein [Nitrososphaerota archaeon]MDG6948873.1 hypothetical protein [Nitrososphaerota archaeon]
MKGSGLVDSPEIEEQKPCIYFGKTQAPMCKECYSFKLFPLRKGASKKTKKGHNHNAAPKKGLIRLGTWIEVTEQLWRQFKAGKGRWTCCNRRWNRPDFKTRPYFMITRGIQPQSFYEELLADPKLNNLQVSTDIVKRDPVNNPELEFYIKTGDAEVMKSGDVLVPSKARLAWFAANPKTIFRLKTTPANAKTFDAIATELGINNTFNVMETPLKSKDSRRSYHTATPLEIIGWNTQKFGRCNSACHNCAGLEGNGVLLCSLRPAMKKILPNVARPAPLCYDPANVHVDWTAEVKLMIADIGEGATRSEKRDWLLGKYPWLPDVKPAYEMHLENAMKRVQQ